ncbi:MAG: hypothetical protein ACOC7S_02740 [Planctomycetota bacterium]
MPSAQDSKKGLKQTEVRLQRTSYQYTKVLVRGGRASTISGQAVCLELVSDVPYTWAHFVAPNTRPGAFALLPLQEGKTYLGWSDGWRVTLADVSSPRDRIVAFHEYSVPDIPNRPAGPPRVNIRAQVPGAGNWGGPQYQLDTYVNIVSLVRDANGELLLTVKDAYSPAAAVLGQRDDDWVLVQNYPDGLPEDGQPAATGNEVTASALRSAARPQDEGTPSPVKTDWGPQELGFRMRMELVRREYSSDEPILALVTVRNVTSEKQYLPWFGHMWHAEGWDKPDRPMPTTQYYRFLRGEVEPRSFAMRGGYVEPGGERHEFVRIDRLLDFSMSREYSVVIRRNIYDEQNKNRAQLETPPVRVQIDGSGLMGGLQHLQLEPRPDQREVACPGIADGILHASNILARSAREDESPAVRRAAREQLERLRGELNQLLRELPEEES